MAAYPEVKLGEVLHPHSATIELEPSTLYKQVTVKLWGKGLSLRNEVVGTEIGSQRVRVSQGQFVISKIDARHGASGVVPAELDGALVSNDFPVFNVDASRLDALFLGWLSKTKAFVESCTRASEGTTNRVRLKLNKFYEIAIPLPPLEEQRRIVARIDELASTINTGLLTLQESSELVSTCIYAELASVFERASGFKSQTLSSVAELARGKFSHRPRNDPRFFGGEHPWIQIGEIESAGKYITEWKETLNDDGLAISRKFPEGTLLVSIAATIGSVGILGFDCCIPDSIVAVIPKQKVSSEYLYYFLLYLRKGLEVIAPQSAQKNINLKILAPLPIPIPSEAEQLQIVKHLDSLQTSLDAVKHLGAQVQAELDALLPSILYRAFKGEL